MSDDDFGGFAPPPFKAADTLAHIKRSLRDLKLTERGKGFDLRGRPVIELVLEDTQIKARVARKWALTPVWDQLVVNSSSSQRKLLDDIKRRLERWEHED